MQQTDKIKIAIINYKPLHEISDGEEKAVETIVTSLQQSHLNLSYKIFVLDSCFEGNTISKVFTQQIIPSSKYVETGMRLERIIDFTSLILFGYKYYSEKMNENADLLQVVSSYHPDVIITVTSNLHGFIKKLKKIHPDIKIVSYMDSPKLIHDSLLGVNTLHLPKFLLKLLEILLKQKYVSYYTHTYFDIASNSDAIVVASEQDRAELSPFLGDIAYKEISVIPPIITTLKKNVTKNRTKTAHSILFIGSNNYFPNQEAIFVIKNAIAPKMPNELFIIAGNGLVTSENKNVKLFGNVKDIDLLIEDADICIAPLLHGSGIKQKVLSYLSHGKPVIGTSIAFNGFNVINGNNAIIEDKIENFPSKIMHLEKDMLLFKKLQKNSLDLAKEFSIKNISEKWSTLISSIV